MSKEYIKDKSIFISDFYYECNIVGCKSKEAVIAYMGNYYCMEHFLEFVMDDLK